MPEDYWGPTIDYYASRPFEPRELDIWATGRAYVHQSVKAQPIACIETSLRKSDPRTINPTQPRGDHFIAASDIMQSVSVYSTVNGRCKVFKHFYGYLCVRYLLHDACLAILHYTGVSSRLFASIPRRASWGEASQIAAREALDKVSGMTDHPVLFEEFCRSLIWNYFKGDELTARISTVLHIMNLWRDRGSFYTLYSKGYLPGCALLLLVYFRMLPNDSSDKSISTAVAALRELMLRLYLAGSPRDRAVLQVIFLPVLHQPTPGAGPPANYTADLEDSQRVRSAFVALVAFWDLGEYSAESVPIDVLGALSEFVINVSTESHPSIKANEQIDVLYANFRLFWLILEHKHSFPSAYLDRFRALGRRTLEHLEFTQRNCLTTKQDRSRFSAMLASIEFTSVIGRIALLRPDNVNEPPNTEIRDELLKDISALSRTMHRYVVSAPELFPNPGAEWAKILEHCKAQRYMLSEDQMDYRQEMRYLAKVEEAWMRYGKPLKEADEDPQECSYPRCIRVFLPEGSYRIRYMCSECKVATYCDSTCQQAHWQLDTQGSHAINCTTSTHDEGA